MSIIKFENIENVIVNLRDKKVIIDQYVANIYGVETKRINEAVKNNSDKFPDDYFFKTTDEELEIFAVEIFDRKIFKNKNNTQCIY